MAQQPEWATHPDYLWSLGRLGGQYAKPRSYRVERSGLHELPVFRGHVINSEVPTSCARRHDPARMVVAYQLAAAAHRELAQARGRQLAKAGQRPVHGGPWSSHEALVLDYERALIRRDSQSGTVFLGSADLPWVGDRTRAPGSPHMRLLASVLNPVACKVAADPVTECVGGPVAGEAALTERYTTLCDPRLNPEQAHELISDWR